MGTQWGKKPLGRSCLLNAAFILYRAEVISDKASSQSEADGTLLQLMPFNECFSFVYRHNFNSCSKQWIGRNVVWFYPTFILDNRLSKSLLGPKATHACTFSELVLILLTLQRGLYFQGNESVHNILHKVQNLTTNLTKGMICQYTPPYMNINQLLLYGNSVTKNPETPAFPK